MTLGIEIGTEVSHGDEEEFEVDIPKNLPILPVRGMVLYPQTAIPLTVGQPRSIRLVDDIMSGRSFNWGCSPAKTPKTTTLAPTKSTMWARWLPSIGCFVRQTGPFACWCKG
ncbi:MAG UNVERIFIED_CONTAM: LON peptidase substrate-binding domain-containing protein [Anaerolineae bacterium]